MDFIKLFISEYGTTILYAVLTALAGYIGIVAKRLYTKYVNDKTKQAVAKTVVQAVSRFTRTCTARKSSTKHLRLPRKCLRKRASLLQTLRCVC